MKLTSFTITLISLAVFVFSISITFGQSSDTLFVPAYPPGTLNEVIHGDTLATGEQAHKVYVLQQNSAVDTTYYITEELRVKNLTLVGKNNPVTGFPPVISVAIRKDNSSAGNIAVAIDNGFVHFKNLYLLGIRADGSQVTQQCVSTSDSCKLIMDGCIFENFGSTGTPNILNTWNANGSDIYVTNCLFRNNQSNIPQNPGMNWAGPGVNAIDTMIVKNSTFFIFGGNVVGSGSSIGYLEFDHNTIFMQTKSSPFAMPQMHNAKITNNIFYSVYSAGLDSMRAFSVQLYWFACKPAILMLDSLNEQLEGEPYFITEADRKIEAVNNAYFWPEKILDNFETMNDDLATYGIVGGKIYAPTWAAARVGAEAILDLDNLSIAAEDNFNENPGFDAALVEAAADSMARFVRHLWENGGDGEGSRPFVFANPTNFNIYANVNSNYPNSQRYPVPENLSYSNTSLKGMATDDQPLGDPNWWSGVVSISDKPTALPIELRLSQNYPNPFNPMTKIKYSLSQSHKVKLKIFNILGEQVAVLVDKKQNAGEYVVNFDAHHLASGVYFYILNIGNRSTQSKKMLLIK